MPVLPNDHTPDLLQHADTFAPFLCRIMAHRIGHPITVEELAARCNWCTRKVVYISAKTSWATVPLLDMVTFMRACDVDLDRPFKAEKRLRLMIQKRFPRLRPRALQTLVKRLQSLDATHPARLAWGKH